MKDFSSKRSPTLTPRLDTLSSYAGPMPLPVVPIFIERNQGYNTLQFYTCDISPENNSENFVGGLQDNGTLLHTDNALDINDMVTGGDGAFCFFDEDEPLLITSTYYNAWYFINLENDDYSYENANSGVFINPSDSLLQYDQA